MIFTRESEYRKEKIMSKAKFLSYHRVIFIIIVVFAVAQLIWWIIFQLSESKHFKDTQLSLLMKEKTLAGEIIKIKNLDFEEAREFINKEYPHLQINKSSFGGQIGLDVKPEFMVWIENESNRRVRMFLSEGIFFTIVLFVGIWFQYYTLNKELSLAKDKNNFIAATTHELKSPITSLQLNAETMISMDLDRIKQKQLLNNMLSDIQRLDSLTGNILAARKSLLKEKQYNVQDIDISALATRILDSQELRIKKEGFKLNREIEPGIEINIDTEAFRLICSNLLDNAVKFSPEKKEITVKLNKQDNDAVLMIQDSGIGIDPDIQGKIFLEFYRGNNEMTSTTPGVGLGLFVVRELVEMYKGKVEVYSRGEGTGSTFYIRFPLIRELNNV